MNLEDYDFDLDEPENKSKMNINTTVAQNDSDSDLLEDEGSIKNMNTIDQNSTQISKQVNNVDFNSINPRVFN